MELHRQQHGPDPRRDLQLLVTLVGTALTGMALWYWMPPGFAGEIAASWLLLLNLLVLYPVVEELLFRGVIQSELLHRPDLAMKHFGISRANMVTSLLFVGLHLINQPPLWAISVLLPSLVLGHFRERYGNLLAPIVLHILFNATWLTAGMT
jgi:uncharacterized protein